MRDDMKLAYYPGCTLKTKALNLEGSALEALKVLGIEAEEMPRWNCCGALFSLADDDLIHHIAPVRNLIRAQEQGCDTIITLCSQCYNTLARANLLMRQDEEKRDTINRFMDEEPDYQGDVEVVHFLSYLRDNLGWDALVKKVKVPLKELKVAPFYGCTLIRPETVAIAGPSEKLYENFLSALGAESVAFSRSRECCSSYQGIAHPDAQEERVAALLTSAVEAGANAIALSCPMCQYNLGASQARVLEKHADLSPVPVYYFTQLLAVALGVEPNLCRFDLNGDVAVKLLKDKEYIASAAV
jgi:heterodisulfide reductase subunit B